MAGYLITAALFLDLSQKAGIKDCDIKKNQFNQHFIHILIYSNLDMRSFHEGGTMRMRLHSIFAHAALLLGISTIGIRQLRQA